jgi:peptidoglycan/LPS O-acetylase OafA/YrhL
MQPLPRIVQISEAYRNITAKLRFDRSSIGFHFDLSSKARMENPNPPTQRMGGLDTARGLAILLVVVFHYFHDRILGGIPNVVVGPFGLGGVALFFMLSGFLIERHLNRDADLFRYFNRRIFRIIPAYFVCLAVVITVDAITAGAAHWTVWQITVNALLLQDVLHAPLVIGVVWSLLIEIKFYALAPFLMRAGRYAIQLSAYAVIATNTVIYSVRGEASTFLMYLAICLLGMQFGRWNRAEMSNAALLAVTIATAFSTYIFAPYFPAGLALFVIIDAAIMVIGLKRPLEIRALQFLGRISYSWYLYHAAVGYPIIAALAFGSQESLAASLIAVTIALFATLMIAWISYRVLEAPGIAFGNRLEKRYRSLPIASPTKL